MTIKLESTGERLIEDAYHSSLGSYVIYVMHAASYRFVEPLCAGKHVLDLGCGSGYGAARIANIAKQVEGVDISDEAIMFARTRYQADNLKYTKIFADNPLPFDDAVFDVALSFQVIEHVENDQAYLQEARRVLRPGGVIIVITPDRKHRLLPRQKPWNRWHVREYSSQSLTHVVGKVFSIERVLKMGAPWFVASVEIKRYRWLKWVTLPVTLSFIPDKWRIIGLNLMHSLRSQPEVVDALVPSSGPTTFGFDEEIMQISEDAPNSMNLLIIARKSM